MQTFSEGVYLPELPSLDVTAPFHNMQPVEFEAHHAKCVLRCCQSCYRPLREQGQYFGGFKRSGSCVVIGGFHPFCLLLL